MDRRSLLDRAAKSAEERVLLGHILDKYDQCRQRNLPTNTAFLSPAEAQGARDLLRAAAIHKGFALLGGYEGAERTALRLTAIGADALRVPEQKVKEIRDTVATLRLDAVTAAGFSMSRGKAAELIAAGRVQKNYREVTKGDASVAQGDVISARGLGKFEVAEVGGLSKKGRTGILLRRYL